jgi:hypothetical protein
MVVAPSPPEVNPCRLRLLYESRILSQSLFKYPTAMQQQVQNLADDIKNKLSLGDKYSELMKNICKEISELDVSNYGIIHDETYITPTVVTRGNVDIQETKRKREINDIHNSLDQLTKMLKKVNREIKENQNTTYRWLMLKKRNRENEAYENKVKKQKKEEHNMKNEEQKNHLQSINSSVSLQDLLAEAMKPDYVDLS